MCTSREWKMFEDQSFNATYMYKLVAFIVISYFTLKLLRQKPTVTEKIFYLKNTQEFNRLHSCVPFNFLFLSYPFVHIINLLNSVLCLSYTLPVLKIEICSTGSS